MHVTIIAGTRNEIKLQALAEAIAILKLRVDGVVSLKSVQVDAIKQPFNEQIVESSMRRARVALASSRDPGPGDLVLGFGIEGGIMSLFDTSYITAYCYAEATSGEHHGAWTAFLECPPNVLGKLESGAELGPAIDAFRTEKGWTWRGGAFGTLTAELYTRKDALVDALVLALVPFFIK
nr:DUF84 family protein [Candidatus Sigynarchaeota archaeon]